MAFDSKKAEALNRTVYHWLMYRQVLGHKAALSERVLSVPFVEYLTQHSGNWTTVCELNHPKLKQIGQGRPFQVDYALLKRGRPVVVWETKFGDITRQSLLRDMMRLDMLFGQVDGVQIQRYFTYATTSWSVRDKTKFANILSLDKDKPTVTIRLLEHDERSKFYKWVNGNKKYFRELYLAPSVIRTKLVKVSQTKGGKTKVLTWAIQRPPGIAHHTLDTLKPD